MKKQTTKTTKAAIAGSLLLLAVTRLSGLITVPILFFATCPSFAITLIFFGVDKANLVMSAAMRMPLNLSIGDNFGDDLLEIHQDFDENGCN